MNQTVIAVFPTEQRAQDCLNAVGATCQVLSREQTPEGYEVVFRVQSYANGLPEQVSPLVYETLLNDIRQHGGTLLRAGERLWDKPLTGQEYADAHDLKYGS